MERILAQLPDLEPGWVWLTGAGPGEAGLLTLLAAKGLSQADVVVYDALVDQSILDLAKPGAKLEYAGKRGGKPSAKQPDISLRLVQLAREGKRVLRLKGGDPFVFGRGWDEVLALAEAGIRYRLIPGVTSGLAATALAGIPATTRDTNHAVVLAAGHRADDDHSSADWEALARLGQPIILYMPMTQLAGITAALMKGGLAADTPAALLQSATTEDERCVESTLGQLVDDAHANKIGSPAIVVIGAVAGLRRRMLAGLVGWR